MIAVPPGVRILLAARPVDFRKGMDGLAALVQQALRADPFAGEVFVFRPRRADRVKILVYDGTGLVLYTRRLEAGRFCWLSPAEGVVRLSAAQLATAAVREVPAFVPVVVAEDVTVVRHETDAAGATAWDLQLSE